jgi:aryl-alcohol dehydrogenase-like predicted oxidoreductase
VKGNVYVYVNLQGLLEVLRAIANKHSSVQDSGSKPDTTEGSGNTSLEGVGGISVANVAARWVLQQEGVGAVILGSHLQHTRHVAENLKAGLNQNINIHI